MAAEIEREHQNEEIYHPDIIFIRKKILPEEIKQELEKLENAFEDKKRKIIDLWESTYGVVKTRYITKYALFSTKLLLTDQASTSDANRGKENVDASRVQFGPETSVNSLSLNQELEASTSDANRGEENDDDSSVEFDPDLAATFYMMWVEEFKKTATDQKEAVLDSRNAWFELLHRLDDDEEEEPQPKQSVSENSMNIYIYSLSTLVLIVACVLFVFQDYDFLKCDDEGYLVCLREIVNFYLKFHDITLEYSNVSDIGHLPESG